MAKKKKRPADAASDESFEDALAMLEKVVDELEGGELSLEAALERYEQGVGGLRRCQSLLDAAARKIELLSGVDADGNPITEPYDDAPTGVADRSAKRSARKGKTGGADDAGEPGGLF